MNLNTISKDNPLILASGSPRRKTLLEQLQIPFRIEASEICEKSRSASASELVKFLATDKANSVAKKAPQNWILGADTVVVIDDLILGKPEDEARAKEMLEKLSGRTHQVLTGFSIIAPDSSVVHSEVVFTKVKIKKLASEEIEAYIQTGEPFGKAGSYAIQGIGAFMVESISGSYTNVVGLPLCALVKALVKFGALHSYPLVSSRT